MDRKFNGIEIQLIQKYCATCALCQIYRNVRSNTLCSILRLFLPHQTSHQLHFPQEHVPISQAASTYKYELISLPFLCCIHSHSANKATNATQSARISCILRGAHINNSIIPPSTAFPLANNGKLESTPTRCDCTGFSCVSYHHQHIFSLLAARRRCASPCANA